MPKLKVLHFKTFYLNLSETFINRLVRNHKDFEPVIATAFKKKYCEGLNVYEMPSDGISGLINLGQLRFNQSPAFLNSVIEKENPSVIHGHFALDSYRLLRVARKHRIPLIVNFYGYDVIRLPKEFGWKTRYKTLSARADHFIAGSLDMKLNLIRLGFPEERIEIIKLGLDMSNIHFKHRTRTGPRLMMVGRMVEKKGFEYALKAVSILTKREYPVHLNLFGDGPLAPSLKKLCRDLDITRAVTFNGQTGNKQIVDQLYHHDMLLSPSIQAKDGDREGIPQTIVEGMASGIPVIGSTHAGIPELLIDEQTGLLTGERDPEAIARSVVKLMDHPKLVSHISLAGRDKVELDHSIHKLVHATENLYTKVIGNAKAGKFR
ncbi:MAG: glycosyltransferase [Balneolales bacterium]